MRLTLSFVLLACLTMTSCQLSARLTLASDGTATGMATLQVSAATRSAWSDLRTLDETLPADPLDRTLLNESLGRRGTVVDSSSLRTSVRLNAVPVDQYLSSWSTSAARWQGTLDREALRRWTQMTWAQSPALEALFPRSGTVSEADYRDLLVYFLGTGLSESAARALVDGSTVELVLELPRPVKRAPGATRVQGSTVTYRWALARVLSMETPLDVRIEFE